MYGNIVCSAYHASNPCYLMIRFSISCAATHARWTSESSTNQTSPLCRSFGIFCIPRMSPMFARERITRVIIEPQGPMMLPTAAMGAGTCNTSCPCAFLRHTRQSERVVGYRFSVPSGADTSPQGRARGRSSSPRGKRSSRIRGTRLPVAEICFKEGVSSIKSINTSQKS